MRGLLDLAVGGLTGAGAQPAPSGATPGAEFLLGIYIVEERGILSLTGAETRDGPVERLRSKVGDNADPVSTSHLVLMEDRNLLPEQNEVSGIRRTVAESPKPASTVLMHTGPLGIGRLGGIRRRKGIA